MLGKVVEALVRIAVALEAFAKRPQTEPKTEPIADAELRAWAADMEKRYAALVALVKEHSDTELVKRLGTLEVEHATFRSQVASLRGKVYREYPEKAAERKSPEDAPHDPWKVTPLGGR